MASAFSSPLNCLFSCDVIIFGRRFAVLSVVTCDISCMKCPPFGFLFCFFFSWYSLIIIIWVSLRIIKIYIVASLKEHIPTWPKWPKSLTKSWPKRLKNHTHLSWTYLYSPYNNGACKDFTVDENACESCVQYQDFLAQERHEKRTAERNTPPNIDWNHENQVSSLDLVPGAL